MGKPSLAVLIGMKKPSKDDDEEMPESGEEGDDEESPHVDAAHEILDAMKARDAEKLSEALKVFYDLCKEEHEGDKEY